MPFRAPPPPVLPAPQLALRSAFESGDLDDLVAAFAPDAIVRSPLTDRFSFRGHDQIRALMSVLLEALAEHRYTDELLGEVSGFLVSRARVGGRSMEFVDHVRLRDDGKISELTVFARPLARRRARRALRRIWRSD
jgi:ketosteroid isomerase-like protein